MIDDRYEVLGRIGSGAVAVVHLARHVQLGTLHAVKVLMVPTPFVQDRLLKEGRAQGSLRDRNVVAVTDVVDVEGAPGLVMNYVRGPSLERFMQHAHLDLVQARALGVGILLGVRSAHALGLVHRDLKPANILLDVDATALVPKIADFGLAKLLVDDLGPTATRAGTTLGTPAYMAPEQIRDARAVDERADVFSLGAVLYELLTSRRAFPGDDLLELYDRIRQGVYQPIRSLAPEVPPEVEAVVDGALQVDRDARISSVSELLDRWSAGQGEAAGEIDWPPTLLALAEGLAPGPQSGPPSGVSAATFDMVSSVADDPALASEGTAEEALGEPLAAVVEVERTLHEPRTEPSLPSRPAPLRRRRWQRIARWSAVGTVLVVVLACAGTVGAVGVGLFSGWLQWGPDAPPPPVDGIRRPVYTADAPPHLFDAATEADHAVAWDSLRDARPVDAREALERIGTVHSRREDAALPLLQAAAASQTGDPAAYARIEYAAKVAGTRRGALPSLARLAGACVAGTATARDVERHFDTYPDDLLGRVLLASLDGYDGEIRLRLAKDLVDQDPDHALGYVVLAALALNRGQLDAADELLQRGLAHVPGHRELTALQAQLALLHDDAAGARRAVEHLGTAAEMPPSAVRAYAGALRMLHDDAGVEAVTEQLQGDDARYVAWALGLADAAFGLGAPGEALDWADRAFARASIAGRLADAVEVSRSLQAMAVLVDRPDGVERAVRNAEMTTALLGLPSLLHQRLTPRILLLNGMLAVQRGESADVQRIIARLEEVDRGERQASLLRAASLAAQGQPSTPIDNPSAGCLVRSLDARWRSVPGPSGDHGALYRLLLADDSPCARFGVDRYARADAEVRLAQIELSLDDPKAARAHLAAFNGWAPDAELESPLFGLLSDVHEALAWVDEE
ncbi:MAG: protein kinase [Myxococcota bacterium]